MAQLYDPQMANIADFDCFNQVVFKSLKHYKMMKEDEKFADTRKSM